MQCWLRNMKVKGTVRAQKEIRAMVLENRGKSFLGMSRRQFT